MIYTFNSGVLFALILLSSINTNSIGLLTDNYRFKMVR